jgi:hypothetical protein
VRFLGVIREDCRSTFAAAGSFEEPQCGADRGKDRQQDGRSGREKLREVAQRVHGLSASSRPQDFWKRDRLPRRCEPPAIFSAATRKLLCLAHPTRFERVTFAFGGHGINFLERAYLLLTWSAYPISEARRRA